MSPLALRAVATLTLGLMVAGCGGSSGTEVLAPPPLSVVGGHAVLGELTISRAYIPDPATPSLAAAYFTVSNAGSGDVLLSVSSPAFQRATLHKDVTSAAGLVRMVPVQHGAAIPAHGRLVLTPGAYHVMLHHPKQVVRRGRTEPLTLRFARAGTVRLIVPVVAATGLPGADASGSAEMNMR